MVFLHFFFFGDGVSFSFVRVRDHIATLFSHVRPWSIRYDHPATYRTEAGARWKTGTESTGVTEFNSTDSAPSAVG